MVVHRGRSCRTDTCGAAACFSRAKGLGRPNGLDLKIKKTVFDLEFVLKKV
jgi:hypothetical protein